MEKEKMLAGKLYDPSDKQLTEERVRAHRLSRRYNQLDETDEAACAALLQELLHIGEGSMLLAPIQFDYGINTTMGKRCFANFNFTVLDVCPVTIGDDVFFGPNCTLATPLHPLLPEERRLKQHEDGTFYDLEYGKPITIGNDCWLASNVVVCGGVTIGEGCVIGAGSVVTRDIPPHSLAAGNPCKVIRTITEADSVHLKKELF
ncbi:MAG: sugar O-acetyltransferase [Oscillospiraceae bacterium]|nr:sugar O-acetyltransferase [Oscillospiraceae bacterium]